MSRRKRALLTREWTIEEAQHNQWCVWTTKRTKTAKSHVWLTLECQIPFQVSNSATFPRLRKITGPTYVYSSVIPMSSSFRRRPALISGPCNQHLSYSHHKSVGFIPKTCFVAYKYKINQIPYIPLDFVRLLWDLESVHNFWRLTDIPWDLAGLIT